jgi:hypothetical protein
MSRKYIRKEIVTICRTEEVSFVDEGESIPDAHTIAIWRRIFKFLMSLIWSGGKND